MREMKDSGVSSFGLVPITWQITKLKNILSLRSIKSGGVGDLLSVYLDRGVISYEDSDGQQVHKPSQDMSNYQIVRPGDFVLNNQQAWRGSVGVSKYNGIISPAYFVYAIDKGCDPDYMNYLFRDSVMVQQYETASRGVGSIQRNLYAPWFLNSWVVVPSLKEQRDIARFLDAKCVEIDALSADIQSEIDTLEAYKRSVITEAVTRGLDKTVPMKDSGIEWAEKVPAHWEVMQNKYIMKKTKEICPVYNNEDILSLTMNGVIVRDLDAGGKMPSSFNGYQIIHPGNLLMCLFDYDVTPRCIGLIKNEGLTSPAYSQFVMKNGNTAEYYYYYYLMIDFTKELLHLAKNLRHSFTEDQLGMINAPVPPVGEQIAIAKYLDEQCAEIEAIIAQKQEQLAVLADYKKSVIYEYVTGKKEVPVA